MDNAAKVAHSASAPADERAAAMAEVQQEAIRNRLSDFIPRDELAPVIDYIQNGLEEERFEKALRKPTVIPFPSSAIKNKKPGMQSVYLDEMQINIMGDWFEKPGIFTFDSMRTMVRETPILNAVIMTRQRQVARFCRPQKQGRGYGFRIALRDETANVHDGDDESIKQLTSFFTNCGWQDKPRARRRLKRDDFTSFMQKLVRESLILDSMPIETEFKRDRTQGLDGMYAVDGATIRLCSELGYKGEDEIYALQVIQGRITAAYTYDDLIYVPRNPIADVTAGGYGLAETELLVRVVTGFLNAFTYNTKYFDSNSIPKGMLHLTGNYSDQDITAFKRIWNSWVKGVNNAWSLPVMVSKDQESKAEFESFGAEQNEVMFSKWMVFLTSIICAIYSIAPDEINFESFTAGSSSLSGSDTEEKLSNSKDKGLIPLMSYFENLFTDYVVSEYGDKYCFRWAGLEDDDEKARFERQKLTMTWNEMRGLDDLPAVEGVMGEAPLNPVLMTPWQQENMAQQQDFGQPDEQGQPGAPEGGDKPGAEGEEGEDGEQALDFGKPEPAPKNGPDAQGGVNPPVGGDPEDDKDAQGQPIAKALSDVFASFNLPVLRIE